MAGLNWKSMYPDVLLRLVVSTVTTWDRTGRRDVARCEAPEGEHWQR